MPSIWDAVSQIIAGGGNLATSRLDMQDAERAAGMADPWGPYRGRFAERMAGWMEDPANRPDISRSRGAVDRLTSLMDDPNQITSMPGYQYGLNQAMEGVNRGASASGMLGSGNRLMALQDRGERYARDWYSQTMQDLLGNVNANVAVDTLGVNAQGQEFGRLDRVAGVGAGSPVAAAEAFIRGRERQQQSIGSGIGGITNGIAGIANSPIWSSLVRSISGGGGGLPSFDEGWFNADPGMLEGIGAFDGALEGDLIGSFLPGDELSMLPLPDFGF